MSVEARSGQCWILDEATDAVDDVVEHLVCESWVDADPKRLLGDDVGVGQVANDAVLDTLVGRLPQQVASEQLARADLLGLEELHHFMTGERRTWFDRDAEAEPARLAVVGGPRHDKAVQVGEAVVQSLPVAVAGLDEPFQLLKLDYPHRSLH